MQCVNPINERGVVLTKSEKKVFLGQYGVNEREIARLEEEIELWKSRAEKITASYSSAPAHGSDGDKMQTAVIKILELKSELYNRLVDATELRRRIQLAIDMVGDSRLRNLLEYRYIDELGWEKIADKLNVEWRHVLRLHDTALQSIKIL